MPVRCLFYMVISLYTIFVSGASQDVCCFHHFGWDTSRCVSRFTLRFTAKFKGIEAYKSFLNPYFVSRLQTFLGGREESILKWCGNAAGINSPYGAMMHLENQHIYNRRGALTSFKRVQIDGSRLLVQ